MARTTTSLVNNFHSTRDDKIEGAARVKAALSRLKYLSGLTEQRLILQLLCYGMEHDPRMAPHFEQMRKDGFFPTPFGGGDPNMNQ